MKTVTSLHNPVVKKVLLLQEKSRERKREGAFTIDGWKEIYMAIMNGFELEILLLREGFLPSEDISLNIEVVEVSETVFDKISYRGSTSKAVAIAKQKEHTLSDLKLSEQPLVLVLDQIEKPGNLGAILRTADAAGIDAVICCDMQTDIYNPNVIRSSVGCIFTMPIGVGNQQQCMDYLIAHHIFVFTASLKAAQSYLNCNYKNGTAFVLGTEATGVAPYWEEHATSNIIIPMHGQNDSLNVSTTGAILLFEALRQRNV